MCSVLSYDALQAHPLGLSVQQEHSFLHPFYWEVSLFIKRFESLVAKLWDSMWVIMAVPLVKL